MDLREIDKRIATSLLGYNLGKSRPKHYSSNLNQTFELLKKLKRIGKVYSWEVNSGTSEVLPLMFTFHGEYGSSWTETDYKTLAADICNLLLTRLT